MSHLSAKFALLFAEVQSEPCLDMTEFQDVPPEQLIRHLRGLFTEEQWGVITFGFSDHAIVDIVNEELDIDPERRRLLFKKTFLDAQSIRLAGAGRRPHHGEASFSRTEHTLIQDLSNWMMDAGRELYRSDLNESRLEDIRQEYIENFRNYAQKCIPFHEPGLAEPLLRSLFGSLKSMMGFCHSLTVDAMFKADAAKMLFGEQSGYYQAWFRKQIFRHMISHTVERYIQSCVML